MRAVASASFVALQRLAAYVLVTVQTLVSWLALRPIHKLNVLALRALHKAWRLLLVPMIAALSFAMLFGFMFGFVLSQVAMYLEVFPTRRGPVSTKSNLSVVESQTRSPDDLDVLWARKNVQRPDYKPPPAASSPPSLEPSPHETEADDIEWKIEYSAPSSDDDSDYLGYTEGEEAVAEYSSPAPTGTGESPKYAGPVGMGFYAQFRPDTSDLTDTVLDDVDDDGYSSPGRSRSRSHITFRGSVDSPLNSPVTTSPPESPLRSRSMSRVHSLTQIPNPIYEEDET